MPENQLSLFALEGFSATHAATWSPRDLWLKLSADNLTHFREDKRIERKSTKSLHFDALAEYYSMWSNTVEGGIVLFGVEDDGCITGCASLTQEKLNRLDNFHVQMCPDASPEPKRIPVSIDGKPDFVTAMYLPYRGTLVETQRGHSYIRYGDAKHQMTLEEKEDFRSTRHERSWEQRFTKYKFPDDFDYNIITEFCSNFRDRERKSDWSDEDILIDRHLMTVDVTPLDSSRRS